MAFISNLCRGMAGQVHRALTNFDFSTVEVLIPGLSCQWLLSICLRIFGSTFGVYLHTESNTICQVSMA